MSFEEYLSSKKIDSNAFRHAEENLWKSWKEEFEKLHPNSFTLQKLNMINPIRRKYMLKNDPGSTLATKESSKIGADKLANDQQPAQKPAPAKPIFKPKPKIN